MQSLLLYAEGLLLCFKPMTSWSQWRNIPLCQGSPSNLCKYDYLCKIWKYRKLLTGSLNGYKTIIDNQAGRPLSKVAQATIPFFFLEYISNMLPCE